MSALGNRRSGLALLIRPERVEAALWRAYYVERSEVAGRRLFDHFRSLADTIAHSQHARRPTGSCDLGDIRQLAYEGLWQSIRRFDPLRGVPFSAFARPRIAGNIANGFAALTEAGAQYAYHRRAERERLQSLITARDASESPLSALSQLAALIAIGLIIDQGEAIDPDATPTREPDAYEVLAWTQLQERLGRAISELGEREAYVVTQHYSYGVSFTQIAAVLRVTKGRVSQIHRAALQRLRQRLSETSQE